MIIIDNIKGFTQTLIKVDNSKEEFKISIVQNNPCWGSDYQSTITLNPEEAEVLRDKLSEFIDEHTKLNT